MYYKCFITRYLPTQLYLNMEHIIATYVFLDLETTGLPQYEYCKTKITELSMVAVKRSHILGGTAGVGSGPRVKHKLTLCFNPGRMIDPASTEITGLCNDLLEFESYFNEEALKTINYFLGLLTKPVCLIAYNGARFDFPVLQHHLLKLKASFPKDIMCADSWLCFYDILEHASNNLGVTLERTQTDCVDTKSSDCRQQCNELDERSDGNLNEQRLMQMANETTPKSKKRNNDPRICGLSKAKRKLPWGSDSLPKESYKLEEVYKRRVGSPMASAHQAETDCIMALEIAVSLKNEFVKWVDKNCHLFSECAPMTVGIPL